MTTPVKTTIPKTQRQQNYNGPREILHATRNMQATPQHKRNTQPLSNPSFPPQNMYPSTSRQQMTERVYQPVTASPQCKRNAQQLLEDPSFPTQNAYPSTSRQAMTQRVYQPPAVRGVNDRGSDRQYQFTSHNAYQSPTQKRTVGTSDDGALVPVQNHYGVFTRKQKEEDMARKRLEIQEKLNRDAQDYMKKKKEKEQKKREEYIMRHKYMFPDLFGGHKLGSNNDENLYENLQSEMDTLGIDPVTLRTQQEEARRKMQEEYDAKARKHAEKMKEIEEKKRAQQAELATKMKAEADKYKVGRLNTTADGNVCIKLDCTAVKLNENEATRKTQDQLDIIGLQNNSCTKIKTDYPIQVTKPHEQKFDKDDRESQEQREAYHYKCGILPVVPTLKLRLDSVNNTVKKHSDEESIKHSANTISKVEEKSVPHQISSINKEKPVDTEKEFLEEMRRARIKMQQAMNLKVQEFVAKSKQESDSL